MPSPLLYNGSWNIIQMAFDPDHPEQWTVADVKGFLEADPNLVDQVYVAEQKGKQRKGLITLCEKLGASKSKPMAPAGGDPVPQDFEGMMRFMAERNPKLTLEDAIWKFDNSPKGLLVPPRAGAHRSLHAEFAFHYEPIMVNLLGPGQKIQAIKDLRAATDIGLKEAKEAIELVEMWIKSGRRPDWTTREVSVEGAAEALESIKASMASLR